MKAINKVAFLVHEPVLYAHYASVWKEMPSGTFVIILLHHFMPENIGKIAGGKELISQLVQLGYEYRHINDVLNSNVKYRYVISNHIMSGDSTRPSPFYMRAKVYAYNAVYYLLNKALSLAGKPARYRIDKLDPHQYLPLQLGVKQIRFMYGADISDGWSLQEWNNIYDIFLCHGPNDVKQISKRFNGETYVMGYPRYDGYFDSNINIDDVVSEFNIDRSKQTILWMPTVDLIGDSVCSIIPFASHISKLMGEYNVIVRPHPISFRKDRKAIELLESLGYKIDRNSTRDMNKPFKLADYIFCDYGGSAFGALYLRKKMVLLKTSSYESSSITKGSSNLALMNCYPVVTPEEVEKLIALLKDSKYWDDVLVKSKTLSDTYFANYRGTSSRKAAEILLSLELA